MVVPARLLFYLFTLYRVSPSHIQIGQLFKLTDDHDNTVALKLVFANYKHGYNQRPFSIVIHRHPPFCPVQLLLDYLALRSNQLGPLFANMDNTSVSRSFFTDILRLALTSCGLNSSRTRVTASLLGLPLSLQIGECPMTRSGLWGGGSPLLFLNIFVYLLFQVRS